MLKTSGASEQYKGQNSSISPSSLTEGLFSLCSGGVPSGGAFARLPGKSMRDTGILGGGIMSIYQFGNHVVVQRYIGIEIYNLHDLLPQPTDFVKDNEGNLVYDNSGLAVTQ